MKHGIKPTVAQKKIIKSLGLNPDNWLVERNDNDTMVIVNRYTGSARSIRKENR